MNTLTTTESEFLREGSGATPLLQTLSLSLANKSPLVNETTLSKNTSSMTSSSSSRDENQAVEDSTRLTPAARLLEGTFYGMV